MNILLVNDDGFDAEGINRLREVLKEFGTIYKVAPAVQQSGKSCSATFYTEIKGEKIDEFDYKVDGTPADCVQYACDNLPVKFDFVVSGCNRGLNCSFSSVWSGTIGACIHAGYLGLPSVAFSVVSNHFESIEKYAKIVMQYILDNNLISKEAIISVNFPKGDAKGIKISEVDYDGFNFVIDQNEHIYLHKEKDGTVNFNFPNKDGDIYHLSQGYISIEPIGYNYCNRLLFDSLKSKAKDVDF